jgi:predicted nucleic acid-binding protein
MIVVSNTTRLIGLATIQRFDLLQHLFGRIYILQAVYDEAVTAGREAGGAKREVSTAGWIETAPVKDQLAVEVLLDELDRGEAETIVLARELNADWVLMDEKKGRRKVTEWSGCTGKASASASGLWMLFYNRPMNYEIAHHRTPPMKKHLNEYVLPLADISECKHRRGRKTPIGDRGPS